MTYFGYLINKTEYSVYKWKIFNLEIKKCKNKSITAFIYKIIILKITLKYIETQK